MSRPRLTDLDPRRRVPAVEQLLQDPQVRSLEAHYGRGRTLRVLRTLLAEMRDCAIAGNEAGVEAALATLRKDLARRLSQAARPSLVPVINATGVVIHTNLGRAPISHEAAARVAAVAASYSNLELDLASGERGDREIHAEVRLRSLLGVEGSVIVNNNAAAVLLAVNTLAEGREVLVSRGELVEIGGSFRIPEVLRKGGARLREVGTTNRTRVSDYKAGLTGETALILKVHPSNYRIVGFTEAPALKDLTELAHGAGIPILEDLGSGLLTRIPGLESEPQVAESLKAGVDLVTMSGDKLLGGPQAGLVVGRGSLAAALRKNPLYRALRVDKMTLAALDAVLSAYETERERDVPVFRMLSATAGEVRSRAEKLAALIETDSPILAVEVVDGASAAGGGAAPDVEIPTALVAVTHAALSAERLALALRRCEPPVIVRVADERVLMDLRTVNPDEEGALREAVRLVAGGEA